MNQLQKEAKTYLKDLLAQGHEVERKRLKNVWEPEVIAIMDAMADQCLAVARLMIKRYAEAKPDAVSYAELQQPLNRAWANIVAEQTEQAKEVIRGGVRRLAQTTAESLTIGGLAAPVPTLASLHPIEAELVDDLAGSKALDSYVAGHVAAFSKAVATHLRHAQPGDRAKLDLSLEAAAALLRGNLHTVARTMLFQAARGAHPELAEIPVHSLPMYIDSSVIERPLIVGKWFWAPQLVTLLVGRPCRARRAWPWRAVRNAGAASRQR